MTRTSFSFSGVVFPDDEHAGSVGIVTVENGRHVDIDDVALLQNLIFAGYAVAHHFVDGGAYAFGKAFVVERCRNGAVCYRVVVDHTIDFGGRHSGFDFFGYQVEYTGVDGTAAAYAFDLFGSLYQVPAGHKAAVILEEENLLVEFGERSPFGNFPVVDDFSWHNVWFSNGRQCRAIYRRV